MIQLFSNSLGDEELREMKKVFDSKWLGYGRQCIKFENDFATKINSNKILLTSSCTAALYIAFKSIELLPGDEVITPTINFHAVPNIVKLLGANLIFTDVDINTFNIRASDIKNVITKKTKAVVVLHYGGHPAEMDEIVELCNKNGIYIIEDSACSVLSKYKDKYCGTIGDIGCYSFDSMKIMCAGEAGALSVNKNSFVEKAKEERQLGVSNRESGFESLKKNYNEWWKIYINSPSLKLLPSDVNGAMLNEQMKKVDGFIERRKEIWNRYQKAFKDVREIVTPPEPLEDCTSSYYMYWIRSEKRNRLANHLISNGIYCSFRYYPLHLINYYKNVVGQLNLKNAEEIANTALNIPLHQNLTDQDTSYIIDKVIEGCR